MGTNLITTEELFKLKEKEKEEKKYFSTEELMKMNTPDSIMGSPLPTSTTPEMGQEPVQKQDMSIGKIIGGAWDSIKGFALNLSQMPKQLAGGLAEQVGEGRLIPRGLDAMAEQMYANAKNNPESISPEDFQQLEDKVFELRDKHLEQYSDSVFEDMHKWGKQALTESLEYVQNHPWVPKDDDKFGQFMFELGQGAASLTSALIVSILTKSPSAAAVMFGAYQSGSVYHEAREKGSSINEAYGSAIVSGMAEAALEKLGLDFMLKRFPGMNKMLQMGLKAASEALQEGSQTLSENTIAKLGYDTERDLMEGVGRSALMGAILGAGAETVLGKFMGDTKISETEKTKLLAKTKSIMDVINKHKDVVLMDAAQDKNLIKEIEAEFNKKGMSFEAQDYMDAKKELQNIRENKPVDRPEIIPTSSDTKQPAPERHPIKLVSLTEEQTEKINRIIPTNQNISKGNLELDKRKLKTPIKEIVSQYVPDPEQAKIVENNINRQVNNVIPKTEVKPFEATALQQEIKEIIQDEINNEIEVYHFTPQKVDVIDPTFMGENLTQAEKNKQENDPVSEKTSAFYTRESNPEKQYVSGTNLYKTKIDKSKLVDMTLPENNKYRTQEGNINETRIKEDGYMGYIAPIDRKAQVKLFEATPVQEMGIAQGSVKEGDALKPMWNIKSKIEPKAPDINIPKKSSDTKETVPLSNQEKQDVQAEAQEVIQKRVVKFNEDVPVFNTQGKEVTLKKGHDYHVYPLGEGKYRLQDGNQVTMYEGDIADLRDKMADTAPGEVAGGGMMFPWEKAEQQKRQDQQEQVRKAENDKFEDTSQSGETGTHRLAERVYLGAIANEIETGLSIEELQQYNKTDMLNNAERAIAYVNKNYDEAVDILLNGGEAYDSQGHILKGGIFAAVKNIATLSGDKSLIMQLATNSHVSRESRFMGAYIKSFDEMGQYDAVVAIKKLHEYKTREAQKRIKNYDKKKQTEINKIDSFMGFDIEKLKKRLRDVFGNKDIYC